MYTPPFHLTNSLVQFVSEISEQVGRISFLQEKINKPNLRRKNRIRTIHSSLAIEQNSLSLEQVTAILKGKRVLENSVEIQEVKNAHQTYELLTQLNPLPIDDLLQAHRLMMDGLIGENGKFRSGGVGIFEGEKLIHRAPPAQFVPSHIFNLLKWYKYSDLHPLIKSSIFHYEFEFTHPFVDGNGRLGRLWHSLLLGQWKEIFFWLPIEELIQSRQNEYYDILGKCDREGDSAAFVELMLEIIRDSLKSLIISDQDGDPVSDQDNDQVDQNDPMNRLLLVLGNETLSSTELMARLSLSHKATFRKNYLNPALDKNLIERTIPDKPKSKNQKYRKRKIKRN